MASVRSYFEGTVLLHEGEGCLVWPFARNQDGYGVMWRNGQKRRVHRLVCEEQHGPAPTVEHEAAHSCGDAGCVARSHLSWKTHAENMADKITHGTSRRGSRLIGRKLSEEEAREIEQLKGAKSQREIARRFNVSPSSVRTIHKGMESELSA